MDGLEAALKIQELNTGVPIVAITANIMADDREVYRKNGMKDCVGKPFTSQELWHCLMKYFEPVNWQTENETRQMQAENELRQKLICNFVKDNQNKVSEIKEAINTGDIKLAHRLAHTLKGNAGQLGKIVLQKAAEDVEQQLKEGLSSGKNLAAPKKIAVLETELNVVLAEFAPLASQTTQSRAMQTTAPFTAAETRQERLDAESERIVLEKLEAMLEMGNPECRELAGALRSIPESEELIQQMEDLDFEMALVSLAELKKKLLY